MNFPRTYAASTLAKKYRALGITKEQNNLLHDYFAAFANFYGILTLGDAFDIINRYNPGMITLEKLLAFADIVSHEENYYYIMGREDIFDDEPPVKPEKREIIIEGLLIYDNDDYIEMLDRQSGKPLYIPTENELLKYKDEMYYQRTDETEQMSEFLKSELNMTHDEADDIVIDCVLNIRYAEGQWNQVLDTIFKMKYRMTQVQTGKFKMLFVKMSMNTRTMYDRGFTRIELGRLNDSESGIAFGSSAAQDSDITRNSDRGIMNIISEVDDGNSDRKIGRNELCPCGSGKKYKKCCGR